MSTDFLAPGRLWLLIVPAALAVLYFVVLRWRRTTTVRFTQVDLLDRVAPKRPRWRRHVVAGIQLLGLTVAVVAIARPVERSTEQTKADGRILVLFDVSLSMEANDVDPTRFAAAQEAARDFVDAVDPGVEVGLISFSGQVNVDVDPTLDRSAMERRHRQPRTRRIDGDRRRAGRRYQAARELRRPQFRRRARRDGAAQRR